MDQIINDWPFIGRISSDCLNLDATLGCGQTFSWKRLEKGGWIGQAGSIPYAIFPASDQLYIYSPLGSLDGFQEYFQITFDLEKVFNSFPSEDYILEQARLFCQKLRILKQDPWETILSFLCSSAKPIIQIRKITQLLRRFYGEELWPGFFSFPSPEDILNKGPSHLEQCKLGFRSDYVWKVASIFAKENKKFLSILATASTDTIRQTLLELPGIGRKIADCVLLFGYARMEVFPIDRWIERVLQTFYFNLLEKRKISKKELLSFSSSYFGHFAGYAQQYLFYWSRSVFWKKGGLWEYQ
ncbi:3-methyladenine DNA glycosylase [Methylacidiphilum sp. Yel]|jgi:N-glycosylase/DNA lyase|uniref:DNA-3-methyladenine glycosylase family protein n=1 Tax=Methylacidiphilum sp. Yel TaxID=1847730 RepID=UPI00106B64BA|nr:DNA glycosylase [Methylacidiphilum sp. Yel]TFE70454.1 3-methyladenine DNA glycosylase [Methylacidiphilum sp. Yel]